MHGERGRLLLVVCAPGRRGAEPSDSTAANARLDPPAPRRADFPPVSDHVPPPRRRRRPAALVARVFGRREDFRRRSAKLPAGSDARGRQCRGRGHVFTLASLASSISGSCDPRARPLSDGPSVTWPPDTSLDAARTRIFLRGGLPSLASSSEALSALSRTPIMWRRRFARHLLPRRRRRATSAPRAAPSAGRVRVLQGRQYRRAACRAAARCPRPPASARRATPPSKTLPLGRERRRRS